MEEENEWKGVAMVVWGSGWIGPQQLHLNLANFVRRCHQRMPVACGCRHVVYVHLNEDSRPTLYAWGENVHGQLGTGDTQSSRFPRSVLHSNEGDEFASLACGRSHSLAVNAKGETFAWGCGKNGRLGLGVPISHQQPCLLGHLRGVRVVEVACGSAHSLALDEDGGLWGWGCHKFGQLGFGDIDQKTFNLPHQVDLLRSLMIASVSAGDKHSLALSSHGEVFSWGLNGYGCLGTGNARKNYPDFVEDDSLLFPEPFRACPDPTRVEIGDSIAAIAAGLFHSSAVGCNGRMFAWGKGGEGQLGNGDMKDVYLPRAVEGLAGKQVSKAACGSFHTAALTSEGEIFVWGWAGDRDLLTRQRSTEPQHCEGLTRPIKVPLTDEQDRPLFARDVCCGGSTLAVVVSGRERQERKAQQSNVPSSDRLNLDDKLHLLMTHKVIPRKDARRGNDRSQIRDVQRHQAMGDKHRARQVLFPHEILRVM